MPHNIAETHQNARRRAPRDRARKTEERGREEKRERGRETVSTTDEAASTTDGSGCVGPSCTIMYFARYLSFRLAPALRTKSHRRKKGWRNPQQGMTYVGVCLYQHTHLSIGSVCGGV